MNPIQLTLPRLESSDEGTIGRIVLPGSLGYIDTLELPWRENEPGKSCIPPGLYHCEWLYSAKHNAIVPHVLDVPGRSAVEIHKANWAGDVDKGWHSDLLGCIAPGMNIGRMTPPGFIKPQLAVLSSGEAFGILERATGRQEFMLEILEPKS